MKRITVTLTEDQMQRLAELLTSEIALLEKAYKPEFWASETAFTKRLLTQIRKSLSEAQG